MRGRLQELIIGGHGGYEVSLNGGFYKNHCYAFKLRVKLCKILIYSEMKNLKPKSTGYNIPTKPFSGNGRQSAQSRLGFCK